MIRWTLLFVSLRFSAVAADVPTPATVVTGSAVTATLADCQNGMREGSTEVTLKGGSTKGKVSATLKVPGATQLVRPTVSEAELDTLETKIVDLSFKLYGCQVPAPAIMLVTVGSDVLPYNVAFTVPPVVMQAELSINWASLVFWAPLAASGLALTLSIVLMRPKQQLVKRMGPPMWDFSASWATNVTLGGGLLVIVLGFTLFPDNGHFLSKGAYMAASVAFPVLAGIAPQAFNIFRKPVPDPSHPTGTQLQGYVLAFIVAAALTTWAATGQSALTALAVDELYYAGYLSEFLATPIVWLLVGLCVGLIVYTVTTVVFMVNHQANAKQALIRAGLKTDTPVAPKWSIL